MTAASLPPPRCPTCGYDLTDLTSERCPECGEKLKADRQIYRFAPTPWSARSPQFLLRGVGRVLVHPRKTLELCNDETPVTTRRAFYFAFSVTGTLILLWPAIRDFGHLLVLFPDEPLLMLVRSARSTVIHYWFGNGMFRRITMWEAWSMTRWWLLFGAIAVSAAFMRKVRLPIALKRLLLFSPYIAVLEIGFMAGLWTIERRLVPEPSNICCGWPPTAEWSLIRLWIIRGAAPSLVMGIIFYRAVLQFGVKASVAASALLVPFALAWSVIWEWWYFKLAL